MTISIPIHGGGAQPVSSDTSGKTIGRVALRAYGFPSEAAAIAEGYRSEAGPAMSVYVVSAAQLASGAFVFDGDPKALPVYAAPAGMKVEGGYSQPIYLAGGSLGGVTPIVPWYLAGGVSAANCLIAYQPKGAVSYAASKINIAHPGTLDATDPAGSVAWDALTGWTFNDTDAFYINTGKNPVLGYSCIVKISAWTADGGPIYESRTGSTNRFSIVPNGGQASYGAGSTRTIALADLTKGIFGVAGRTPYYNGVNVGADTTGTLVNTNPIFIGAGDNNGALATSANGTVEAFALYSVTLTAPQMAAIATALNSF